MSSTKIPWHMNVELIKNGKCRQCSHEYPYLYDLSPQSKFLFILSFIKGKRLFVTSRLNRWAVRGPETAPVFLQGSESSRVQAKAQLGIYNKCLHSWFLWILWLAKKVDSIVFTQGTFYGKSMFAENPLIKVKFFVADLIPSYKQFGWKTDTANAQPYLGECVRQAGMWPSISYWLNRNLLVFPSRNFQTICNQDHLPTSTSISQFSQRCDSATADSAVSTSFTISHLFTKIYTVSVLMGSFWQWFGLIMTSLVICQCYV